MVNWNAYLESVCTDYAQWWDFYTLTDVEGRQRVEPKQSSWLLHFDLKVQTVQPAKEQRGEAQQKTERLGVLEGLRKYAPEHVLLVGRPGSGKSTALARLLLEEAQKARGETGGNSPGKIPVLVELRYYRTSVLDLIGDFLQRHQLLLDSVEIEQLLFHGRLLLLVDGLNELPFEAARRDLKALRQNYQKTTPMIFTTRDLGVGSDLGIAKQLEMQPLTEAQMQQFVRAYLPMQSERMLRQLGNRLREFGQAPLLLWMLCSLFEAEDKVPLNLGLVFRQFTQIYDKKLKWDAPVTDESRRWWQMLLEHLAFRMTQGSEATELQVAIPRLEAEEILTEFLREEQFDQPRYRAISWLQDLLSYHLIQLVAGDKIEFVHQLIQEYYTAESLLKQLPHFSNDKLKWEYLNYLKWTEPIALMLDLVEQVVQALRVIKLALEVDLRLGARLAGAVKPEFQAQTVVLVAERDIPHILKIWLLGITHSDSAIPILHQAMTAQSPEVQRIAVEALKQIDSDSTLKQVLEHSDRNSLSLETDALREYPDSPELLCYLSQLLLTATENNLYELLNKISVIQKRYKYYNYTLVQEKTQGFVRISGRTTEKIAKEVKNELDQVFMTVDNEVGIPALVQALREKDVGVRARAAEALGQIGSEAAVSALIRALQDEDSFVRWRATEALGQISNEAAISPLLQALQDEDSNIRWRATKALGQIGSEAAVSALIRALQDEDSFVCRNAAEALGQIGSEAALPALIQALQDEDSDIRAKAAEALGQIGSEATIPTLLQVLASDEDAKVRSRTAKALGQIGGETAIAALLQALSDPDAEVRSTIAEALGQIGSDEGTKVWRLKGG